MDLDIRTLSVLTSLVTAGLAVALFGFWAKDRRCQATLLFATAMALQTVGFGALAMRHLLSPFATIILANGAIALGFMLLVGGATTLVGQRAPALFGTILFAIHSALFLHFTYVDTNVVARIVVISTLVGLCNAYAAVVLFQGAESSRSPFPRKVLAGVFMVGALHMAVRIVLTLNAARIEDFMSAGHVQALAFLFVSFSLCAVALCAKWAVFADAIAEKQQSAEQLRKKIAEYEQLSSVLAHDLRAPAASVVSTVRVLRSQMEPQMTERHGGYLVLAEEASERLMGMLDSIMEHNSAGGARDRSSVSIRRAATIAADNIATEVELSRAIISVDSDVPHVQGNESDLVRIFQNLFQNAIKYRHPDRAPRIRVVGHRGAEMATIRIFDNGAGIPEAKRESVFGMFTRLDRETAKGSGIGLACCRRIAEALGGTICVEANDGEGSVFVLKLPVARELRDRQHSGAALKNAVAA